MDEKKKVFIKGQKGRGSEIADILIGLGATAADVRCVGNDRIYFITHDNNISVALVGSELGRIIMDNYREIELPWQRWKEGDIHINDNYSNCYAVFKKYNDDDAFFDSYYVMCGNEVQFYATEHVEHYHLANKDEQEDANRACKSMLHCIIDSDRKLATQVAQSRV